MINALGLLEVRGLTAGIEAADAMLKAAQVRLLSQTHIPPGLITLVIEGDLAACRAALDAGSAAAERLGTVIARKEIGRPEADTERLVTSLHRMSLEEAKPSRSAPATHQSVEPQAKQNGAADAISNSTPEQATETTVFSYITKHPQGCNITEVMAYFNITRMEAKRLLDNCISQGKLRKRGNRYSLVEVKK